MININNDVLPNRLIRPLLYTSFLFLTACGGSDNPVVEEDPSPIVDNTDPDGSDPDGSNPDGFNPDGSNPDGSNPDDSNPDGSNPDGSNPDGSDPNNLSVIEGIHSSLITEGNLNDDALTTSGTLSISDVDVNDSPTFNNQASTLGDSSYGSFELTDGVWTFTLDQSAVQSLNAAETTTDTITYTATDNSTQLITVTITGSDDAPIISGNLTAALIEGNDGDDVLTVTGTLAISDLDTSDSPTFNNQASTLGDSSYGSFALTDGVWTYTLDQSAVQSLNAGDTATDTIIYTATDSSTQLITVTITGSDDASIISGTHNRTVVEGSNGDDPVTTTGSLSISDVDSDDSPVFNNQGSTLGENKFGNFVLTDDTWTYTLNSLAAQGLNSGDVETDSITYTASNSNSQTITITINGAGGTVASNRESNSTCFAVDTIDSGSTTLTFNKSFESLAVTPGLIGLKQPKSDSSFWFGIERAGKIISFNNDAEATDINEVFDLTAKVSTDLEMGLTGLAIHPNYPTDNRIFIIYNDSDNGGRSTLSSFTINTATKKASDEQVLLTIPQPATNHNGGDMEFGFDGYLYAAFGDGGSGMNTSQELNNLLGTMIRIDISPSTGYNVPSDNPYNVSQTKCSAGSSSENCPEVFAHGFRNPWRWSVDSETGDIWLADVGEDSWEEINLVKKGLNYGWPVMEGAECFDGSSCDPSPYENPITAHDHDLGSSITGGYVYRGTLNSELIGQYLAGGYWSREIISVPADAELGTDYTILFNRPGISLASFAQDNAGEIYALNLDPDGTGDSIWRLEGGQAYTGMPGNLSETGCFDTTNKVAATGVVNFDVNSKLWSDGAAKERQFALPDDEEISVLDDGDFSFPEGSILIKHFLHQGNYLETRLLVLHSYGWQGYSYEWNDAQTDAVLLSEGKTKDIGEYTHIYPSSSQCFACHSQAADISLGIEAKQLNYFNESEDKMMLQALSQAGYLDTDLSAETATLFAVTDELATTTQKARSYLHSNCSGCHRPAGPADFMNLRFDAALADMNVCNIAATNGDMDLASPNRVTPGNADNSVLLARMKTVESNRMPPLGSLVEDTVATATVEAWINSLSACP